MPDGDPLATPAIVQIRLPAGVWLVRVGRQPQQTPPPGSAPYHRFDDPDRGYRVWYTAETVRGCLLEVVQSLRPHRDTLAALQRVDGVGREQIVLDLAAATARWVAGQQVVWAQVPDLPAVDLTDPTVMDALDRTPLVQQAMTAAGYGAQVHLDLGIVLSGDPAARQVSQAIGATVYRLSARTGGIRYQSRRGAEICWALFDRVQVGWWSGGPLPLDHPVLQPALAQVLAEYAIG